jgi:hypothetical protein
MNSCNIRDKRKQRTGTGTVSRQQAQATAAVQNAQEMAEYLMGRTGPQPEARAVDRVGRLVTVSGGKAVVMLDAAEDQQHERAPEIGTLLKVELENTIALALVSGLSMPMIDSDGSGGPEMRIAEVEFIGELTRDREGRLTGFRRGVSQYPGLGDVVARATREELKLAYACDGESSIKVGVIHQDPTIPAMIKLDEMLGKHFAVLGTTGTGKSCSVALILRRILEKNPNAHILLLDVHREYASAFRDMAEIISPETLNLPFWLLNFEEICEILVGEHSQKEVDIEVLRELIPLAKARYRSNQRGGGRMARARENVEAQNIGVDTPLPYRASDLMGLLEEHIGKLENKSNLAPYKRIKAKLEMLTRDPRYTFMFGSLTVHDTMAEVLGRLFRIPVQGRPITVLELGGLPSEVINVVVSVLARLAFDFGLHSGGRVPITFVCEEAHRYVPNDPKAGFDPTRRAISRIAKEGRKYGVSLCIITQRPAELDPTILSQCNTVFSLRLSNELDQEILRAGISDSAASLLDFMPTMGVGEAVAFGEGVSLPTRIRFDRLPVEHQPRSATASFSIRWREDINEPNFLHSVVARWRQQSLEAGPMQIEPVMAPPAGAEAMAPPAGTPPQTSQAASHGTAAGLASAGHAPAAPHGGQPHPAQPATPPAGAPASSGHPPHSSAPHAPEAPAAPARATTPDPAAGNSPDRDQLRRQLQEMMQLFRNGQK